MNIEYLIKHTDSLTYLNALKVGLAELKEELATLEQTNEYQTQAIERSRKVMRRLDNQYRAIVKAATSSGDPKEVEIEEDWSLLSDEEINARQT